MFRLAALFYVIIAPTLMGALVIVTLVVESLYNGVGIAAAAGIGAVLAIPAAWHVAKTIRGQTRARPA
jgi:hypothetical protein